MIVKSDSTGTNPVSKITPLIPATVIGDTAGEAGFRLEQLRLVQTLSEQLVKGQVYQGKVVAKLDDQSSVVNLNGIAIRMTLGEDSKIGQSVPLKFMGGSPNPVFMLSPTVLQTSQHTELTTLSQSAQLIGQFLGNNSENKQLPTRFEAQTPITSSPLNPPQVVADNLKQAISLSGLFYESHLHENAEGKRPISSILQEPQNQRASFSTSESPLQSASNQTTLIPQQLNILENQKLNWHGEVWPNQLMEWEIQHKTDTDPLVQDQPHSAPQASENDSIESRITLHLPNLGSVTARLALQNGKMRVQILADEMPTSALLKEQSAVLAKALEASGQSLESLSVQHHEHTA